MKTKLSIKWKLYFYWKSWQPSLQSGRPFGRWSALVDTYGNNSIFWNSVTKSDEIVSIAPRSNGLVSFSRYLTDLKPVCHNGGTVTEDGGTFKCVCSSQYTGAYCESGIGLFFLNLYYVVSKSLTQVKFNSCLAPFKARSYTTIAIAKAISQVIAKLWVTKPFLRLWLWWLLI